MKSFPRKYFFYLFTQNPFPRGNFEGQNHRINHLLINDLVPGLVLVREKLVTNLVTIAARVLDEAIGWRTTSWHNLSDMRHLIEVGWQAASTPGGSDGSLDLWIDGVFEQTLSGVENGGYWIDDGWLGPLYGFQSSGCWILANSINRFIKIAYPYPIKCIVCPGHTHRKSFQY